MIGHIFKEKTSYWRIEREVKGFNGAGGYWIEERWNWPTGGTCRTEIRTLTREESLALIKTELQGSETMNKERQ